MFNHSTRVADVLERSASSAADPNIQAVPAAVDRAARALLDLQRPDGHFLFDLEADAAIPAEYILLKHYLGRRDPVMEGKVAAYLRRTQEGYGGWPMLARGGLNLSATVKAYFALKAVGDPIDAPHMARARAVLLEAGGAANVNMFTRITLALFGIVPWRAVPAMPVELMHAPGWFPIHIYRMSYWARDTLVPLLVLMALRPRAKNPLRVGIDELFVVPPGEVRRWPRKANQTGAWGAGAIPPAGRARLYFGAPDPKGGAVDHGPRFFGQPTCHHRPEVYGGIGEAEAGALLRQFFAGRR